MLCHPPFNIRPQLPCNSPGKALRPSDGISFTFLARRRILYRDVAHHLQKLTKAFNPCSNNGVQARWGMLALTYWRPFDGEAIQDGVPQIDEAARLAGLLSYLLVYEGGYHDLL